MGVGLMLVSAVVFAASICLVQANPGGPPEAACSTLTPQHPGSSQTSPVPYVIDLEQFETNGSYAYTPGRTYTLTLSDPAESTFRGFFVQSRLSADGTSRVGTFAVTSPGHSQLSPCPRPEDGIVHDNTARSNFTSMTMRWTAPPAGTGPIQFAYAVVKVYRTYWANERSELLEEGPTDSTSATVVGVWSTVIIAVAVTLKNII